MPALKRNIVRGSKVRGSSSYHYGLDIPFKRNGVVYGYCSFIDDVDLVALKKDTHLIANLLNISLADMVASALREAVVRHQLVQQLEAIPSTRTHDMHTTCSFQFLPPEWEGIAGGRSLYLEFHPAYSFVEHASTSTRLRHVKGADTISPSRALSSYHQSPVNAVHG